jgi:UDP-N-acetylmuramoyl-L-alanyl-D-glutamate--2,6-diaminopimelate ligase
MCTKAIPHLPEVFPVTSHTDYVGAGSTFVAIKGFEQDGINFIARAIEKGASKIVASHEAVIPADALEHMATYCVELIRVDDPRKELALLSAAAADYPAKKLKIIGVTGTKGKTTTTFLLNQMLRVGGKKTAMTSSIYNEIDGGIFPTEFATPQADYLHQFLKACVHEQIEYVVMEIAAQAVTVHRTYGLEFDAIIFTNLSQEHGEFYATMDDYFSAKTAIFDQLKRGAPLFVNADDQWGQKILASSALYPDVSLCSYGIDAEHVDFRASEPEVAGRLLGTIKESKSGKAVAVACPVLIGKYNMYNALAATACIISCEEITSGVIENALDVCPPIPGRLERYFLPNGAVCIIDYAHNPSSYRELLSTLRQLTKHLIVVFGCGGKRDAARRPIMGGIAAQYADEIILTSDNPRTEDPTLIMHDIERGIAEKDREKVSKVVDRKQAIEQAYERSRMGSLCVLLGKGPNEYQIVGTVKSYFSEVEIIGSFK